MAILFIRHAESAANAGGVTMPHAAIPLSEQGRMQANALAVMLPTSPSAVLVSGMVRTRQTAAPYCARVGMEPREHVGLNEFSLIDAALIAGMDGTQRRQFVSDYWDNPDPHRRWGADADTFIEFTERVRGFIAQLDELADSSVIFGHGIWLIMLHWLLHGNEARTGSDMAAFQRYRQAFQMPNCAVFRLKRLISSGWTITEHSFARLAAPSPAATGGAVCGANR
jgi:broad specificity phosphatase PhoE